MKKIILILCVFISCTQDTKAQYSWQDSIIIPDSTMVVKSFQEIDLMPPEETIDFKDVCFNEICLDTDINDAIKKWEKPDSIFIEKFEDYDGYPYKIKSYVYKYTKFKKDTIVNEFIMVEDLLRYKKTNVSMSNGGVPEFVFSPQTYNIKIGDSEEKIKKLLPNSYNIAMEYDKRQLKVYYDNYIAEKKSKKYQEDINYKNKIDSEYQKSIDYENRGKLVNINIVNNPISKYGDLMGYTITISIVEGKVTAIHHIYPVLV